MWLALFSPTTMCFGGEQNRGDMRPQSEKYLHKWGGVVTDSFPPSSVLIPDTEPRK